MFLTPRSESLLDFTRHYNGTDNVHCQSPMSRSKFNDSKKKVLTLLSVKMTERDMRPTQEPPRASFTSLLTFHLLLRKTTGTQCKLSLNLNKYMVLTNGVFYTRFTVEMHSTVCLFFFFFSPLNPLPPPAPVLLVHSSFTVSTSVPHSLLEPMRYTTAKRRYRVVNQKCVSTFFPSMQ